MNSDFCKEALNKVGNANVLINLVSRRVRQLNTGGGGLSRPFVENAVGMTATDIAFQEIINDKIGWDMPEEFIQAESAGKKKKRKR